MRWGKPAVLALALSVAAGSRPAVASAEGIVTGRRALGVAFLGGSAALVQRARGLGDEADEFLRRYQEATDQAEIERLYQRTNNRDVKSQVSWALATAFAISGLRLIITDDPSAVGPEQSKAVGGRSAAAPELRVEGRLDRGWIGVGLIRGFY